MFRFVGGCVSDLNTEDKLEYHFFPVSSGSVQFKVRTPNDAHIALTMGPQESDPMVEVSRIIFVTCHLSSFELRDLE